MEDTDSLEDEIYQEYNPKTGFNYEEFVRQVAPLIPELMIQDGELGPESTAEEMVTWVDYPDQEPKIREMFTRMGIPQHNGKRHFVLIKPFGDVMGDVVYITRTPNGQEEKHEGEFPIKVAGMLIIYPHGLEIIN